MSPFGTVRKSRVNKDKNITGYIAYHATKHASINEVFDFLDN